MSDFLRETFVDTLYIEFHELRKATVLIVNNAFVFDDLPEMKKKHLSNVPQVLIVKPWTPSAVYSSTNFEMVSASKRSLKFPQLKTR